MSDESITIGKWHGLTVTVIGRDPRLYTIHFELVTEKGVAALVAFGVSPGIVKLVNELETYASRNEIGKRLLTSASLSSDDIYTERSWEVGEGDKPIVELILEELAKE